MIPSRFTYPSPGFQLYWNNGHGKKLLGELTTIPDKDTIEKKIPLLLEYDSLADEVISELYLKMGYKEADRIIEEALNNGYENIENLPLCVKNLFQHVEQIPDWLDHKKLETGASFCRRTGISGLIVLRNYALMGGYESSAINKPLIFTGALKKGAAKRIAETVEFWVNITEKNALDRSQVGFRHAIKVRLMHSYARVSILKMSDWDTHSWGIPLNHWDMVATNLGFSMVFLDGLQNLGYKPTAEEEEGIFHFWKYVGFLLGIPPQYLPNNRQEAISELYKWTISQPPADEDTKALALALMNEPLLSPYLRFHWQKKLIVQFNLGYNHFFLKKHSIKTLSLPNTPLKYYPYAVKIVKTIQEIVILESKRFRKSSEKWGRANHEKVKEVILKGERNLEKNKK